MRSIELRNSTFVRRLLDENLPPLDLGFGAGAGFTKDNHPFSKSVYGTGITPDGKFQNRYFWSDGNKIQLFE